MSPSRSTRGSMAFCTVSDAGYCRAPRPAAVITALEICTERHPLYSDRRFRNSSGRTRARENRGYPLHARGLD